MSLDFLAIANALAARYAPAQVTPPTGYTNVTASTAMLPNGIATTPAVLVFHENGTAVIGGGRRTGEHTYRVRFFYDRSSGDLRKDVRAIESWLGVLWDQTFAQSKLGLSTVMKALPESYVMGDFEYAGVNYYGFDILVTVWTEDNVTLTP